MKISTKQRMAGKDKVTVITVRNNVDFEVDFTDFGAAIHYISYPDKEGKMRDVTICSRSFNNFVHSGSFYGKSVGRVAGRLGDGKCIVNGKVYNVDINEGKNTLHGGFNSMGFKKFAYKINSSSKKTDIIFTVSSPDGESGFPANVKVKIVYTIWEDKKDLNIKFIGSADAPTLLNLTNHLYVNLNGGSSSVRNHELYLRAHKVSSFDDGLIIQGFEDVPPYLDYTSFAKLGDKINEPILMNHRSHGMDHVFLFDGINKDVPSAILQDHETGRKMTLYTDLPAMICYVDNFPSGLINLSGYKDEANFGLTFETLFPTNDPDLITFSPDRPYNFFAKYCFE